MKNNQLVILLFIISLFSACSDKESYVKSYLGNEIPKTTLDAHLEERMAALNIPGMSIVFINKGQVEHHKVFGYVHLQDSIPITENTIFEAASVSKPIFAYWVMKYVDAGKLDLDKPLFEYLPYPDIEHDQRYKQITARMVLSHQSGFPNWRTDFPDQKLFIQFDPGTDYHYSGEGYQYLAMVLKSIDQTDWEGLEATFQSIVCQPLGMQHTVFIQDEYSKLNKAEPHDEFGSWISPQNDADSSYRQQFRAAASVHTEAMDFSKWMLAIMNKEGLTSESFDQLMKPHSFVGKSSSLPVHYTLGFFHPKIPLSHLYFHGGNNLGFTAFFALDPEKDWGFALFTNSESGEELGNELLFFLLLGPDNPLTYFVTGILLLFLIIYGFAKLLKNNRKNQQIT